MRPGRAGLFRPLILIKRLSPTRRAPPQSSAQKSVLSGQIRAKSMGRSAVDEPAEKKDRPGVRLSMMELQQHRSGGYKKLADQLVCSGWCMTRVCLGLAAAVCFLTIFTVANDSFPALFHPRRLMRSRQHGPDLNYLKMGQGEVEIDRGITIETVSSIDRGALAVLPEKPDALAVLPEKPDALAVIPQKPDALAILPEKPDDDKSIRVRKFGSATISQGIPVGFDRQPYIEDMVALPENLDLFLVRKFSEFSLRDRVTSCRYGVNLTSKVLNADFVDGRLAITCMRPEQIARKKLATSSVSIEVDDGGSPRLNSSMEYRVPARWDAPLVYGAVVTPVDVAIFVKGVFDKRKLGDYSNLTLFKCVFGLSVETEVTAAAQEVYRCALPEFEDSVGEPLRQKVYLRYKGHVIPSVAYYNRPKPARGKPSSSSEDGLQTSSQSRGKKHVICACTMVWNAGKFLKEWIQFNSHLGVEKFFLYDNNSEDDLRGVVNSLAEYNVTRHSWPWVKTQEAGFSHCAIRAGRECTWLLFTDVDEYFYPKWWLDRLPKDSKSAMQSARNSFKDLIADTQGKVILKTKLVPPKEVDQTLGQISVFCRNFGPSGLSVHPAQGVTQGYTCRDTREQRHKSLVLLKALRPSLANVIHHFDLLPEYMTMYTDPKYTVINHYKFQVWPEFETKFTKRASTYVVDWKEPKNLNSRDRPEGVGPDAKKPDSWEASHCQVNDTSLRDYTRRMFRIRSGPSAGKMTWEL